MHYSMARADSSLRTLRGRGAETRRYVPATGVVLRTNWHQRHDAVAGLVGLLLSALWPTIASTTVLARNKVRRRGSEESQMPDHP